MKNDTEDSERENNNFKPHHQRWCVFVISNN